MFVSISAYKFANLGELTPLRTRFKKRCDALALRGTILLSPEGINVFVSGTKDATALLLADLRELPALRDLEARISPAQEQAFDHMFVKIKKEIIAFGVPGIDPVLHPSRRLCAATLKQWLDEGRAITLLDTRNGFEVDLGTFKNALATRTSHFRDFPAAVAQLPAALKEQTVVTFCTGGIRCEKAAPYLEQVGFTDVWQLDGGILKYFATYGGAHYEGQCFVFDKRETLNGESALDTDEG